MARRDKSTSTVSAAVMPEEEDFEYNNPASEPEEDDDTGRIPTVAKPRLIWSAPMDEALTSIVRETRSSPDVIRRLQSHEAFENFPASIITRLKVGTRLSKLRKLGVDVPKLQATGGGFGPLYVPDVERLNTILAEPVEPVSSE